MKPEDVVPGEVYRVTEYSHPVFLLDGIVVAYTYTPGSVVKVVGKGVVSNHIATELLVGSVAQEGAGFLVEEEGLHGLWVHAEELEPLGPDQHPHL